MATNAKAKAPRATGSTRTVVHPEQFSFEVPNEPNADILLDSLRSSGYSLESVIGDLIDNPIDADATTIVVNMDIDLGTEEWVVEVADDGYGMDEPVLDQMMRLGSRAEHDLESGLGAFGLGSDTAALAIGRNKHVVTKPDPAETLSAMWDLDAIRKARAFVKHQGERRRKRSSSSRQPSRRPTSRCRGPARSCGSRSATGSSAAAGSTRSPARSQVHRPDVPPVPRPERRADGGRERREVEPIDPMMRQDVDTQLLLDEPVEFTWKDEDGVEQSRGRGDDRPPAGQGRPRAEQGSRHHDRRPRATTSSGTVARSSNGTTLGLFGRHAEYSRFRCELSFPAKMDSQLGVTFLKSSVTVRPTQASGTRSSRYVAVSAAVAEAVQDVAPEGRTSRCRTRRPPSRSSAKSALLRKPETKIEKRGPRGDGEPRRRTGRPDPDADPARIAQKALADQARFEARHAGPTPRSTRGRSRGAGSSSPTTPTTRLPAAHPRQPRQPRPDRRHRLPRVVARLGGAPERRRRAAAFAERMREDASFNLRQLLAVEPSGQGSREKGRLRGALSVSAPVLA